MSNTVLTLILILLANINAFAQKQSFDVVLFTIPKGWQQQQFDGGLQLSFTEKKTGEYAIALITKATAGIGNPGENFNADWNRLVKTAVEVEGEPQMSEQTKENNWEIVSGGANYTDGNNKGMATLLTATGGGQMASVLLMTNTSKYQNELLSFINSLELSRPPQTTTQNPVSASNSGSKNIVGLWRYNILETSGHMNGMPMYTAGYFRREYAFYPDGTYLFRIKNWSTTIKEIIWVYETGTYVVNGNQLTLTPSKGKGEYWSKKDNNTTKWGGLIKTYAYKLEKTTYNYSIKYFSGSKNYSLNLMPANETQRDGTLTGDGYHYSNDGNEKSNIDNPPGFKSGFENKSFSATTPS